MGLKDELKVIAYANDIDYFGVASVERFANAPEGHKPNDLLPMARSVIVLGIRIPKGAIEANQRAYEGLRHGIFSYMLFGYNILNERLDYAAMKIGNYIKNRAKANSFLLPASVPRDEYLMMGVMSNRHAAVCAGLAEFGWNGLALTPKDGPRVRWVPIISEEEIEPDPLYDGPQLCDHDKCSVCVNVCPVKAISQNQAIEINIENKKFMYALLNKTRCRCGVTGLASGTAGRLQAEIPPINSVEEWREIAKGDNPWNKTERIASMCGRCMIMCPVSKQ